MSNPLVMAIIGTLHPAAAAPLSGITYVGSNVSTATGTSIALPSGCAVGDFVLVLCGCTSSTTATLTGATTILAHTLVSSPRYILVLGYVLTSTDIANGSIPVAWTGNGLGIDVYRGVNASAVDVTSTLTTDTAFTEPTDVTIGSINTTFANDMLVGLFVYNFTHIANATETLPSGYTAGITQLTGNKQMVSCWKSQAAAGATGSVAMSMDNGNTGACGGILVALRPA